jgi:hypothetical protein
MHHARTCGDDRSGRAKSHIATVDAKAKATALRAIAFDRICNERDGPARQDAVGVHEEQHVASRSPRACVHLPSAPAIGDDYARIHWVSACDLRRFVGAPTVDHGDIREASGRAVCNRREQLANSARLIERRDDH